MNEHLSLKRLVILSVFVISIVFISQQQWLISVDRFLLDRYQIYFQDTTSDGHDIVIVALDDTSISELGRWPWPRSYHAQLLSQLGGAKAVVFDILFPEHSADVKDDDVFVQGVADHGKVILPLYIERRDNQGQVYEVMPFPELFLSAAAVGHIHVEHDDDSIIRGVYLKQGVGDAYWQHVAISVLQLMGEEVDIPGKKTEGLHQDKSFGITRNFYNLIRYFNVEHFSRIPYVDVYQGKVPSNYFDDKIVFVGATATGFGDGFATPVTRGKENMPGVEVNANVLHSLRHNLFIEPAERISSIVAVALFSVFVLMIAPLLSSGALLVFSVGLAFSFLALEVLTLFLWNSWFHTSALALAALLCYPIITLLRFSHVVRFFNREITSLNDKEISKKQTIKLEDIENALDFLKKVDFVLFWQLEKIDGEMPSKGDFIQMKEGLFQLEVHWNERHDYSEAKKSLHNNFIHSNETEKKKPHVYVDYIDQYIQKINHLQKRNEEFQNIVNRGIALLKDAVVIADSSGQILFSNQIFNKNFGELKNINELFLLFELGSLNWSRMYQTFLQGDYNEHFDLMLYQEQRERSFLLQGGFIGLDGDASSLLLSFTDITDSKREQMQKERKLHYISHDLRSPISSIITLTENELEQNPDSAFAKKVMQYSQKNLDYANSFLDISRAELVSEDSKRVVNFVDIIEAAKENVFWNAHKKGIEIDCAYEKDEIYVNGVADMLERAIQNLLDNAIKHSSEGQIIQISVVSNKQSLRCEVKDQGKGISDEQLPAIFKRFNKAGFEQGQPGAGLGLSLVATVVERHHGDIMVDNHLEEGVAFVVSLPVCDVSDDNDISG